METCRSCMEVLLASGQCIKLAWGYICMDVVQGSGTGGLGMATHDSLSPTLPTPTPTPPSRQAPLLRSWGCPTWAVKRRAARPSTL